MSFTGVLYIGLGSIIEIRSKAGLFVSNGIRMPFFSDTGPPGK